jgi:hypothetical protein
MEEKLSPLCVSYHIPVYGSWEDCCAGARETICAQMLHDVGVHNSRCEHDKACAQVYNHRTFAASKVDSGHDTTCA